MRTCIKMVGFTEEHPNYCGDATRTYYECYVAYNSCRDHERVTKDFLRWYCDYDIDADDTPHYELLDDYNCVRALITYYFRDHGVRFEHGTHGYVAESSLSQRIPDQRSDTHDLWAIELRSEQVKTFASAAHFLYNAVECQKLPVDLAQALVASEFKGCSFSWDDVLREFRKLGGAHTDRYLRKRY